MAGCGGDDDNGIAGLSAAEILTETQEAAEAAESLRVEGAVSDEGSEFSISMELTADSSTGTLSAEGISFELLSVGDDLYMRADADAWTTMAGDPGAGALLADRYVLVPPGDTSFDSFADFGGLDNFTESVLTPVGSVTKGDETEVNGEPAIGLVSSEGGVMYIATTGDPLPVRLDPPEGQTGGLDFEWDVSVDIEAPDEDDIVDLSSIL